MRAIQVMAIKHKQTGLIARYGAITPDNWRDKMKQEELNLILENHKKWLNNNDVGIRADLRGADLIGANLRDANLRCADLRDADLIGANLRCADLSDADLRGADLRCANLRDADLRGADLIGANLRDANLSYTNLRGADLRDANLRDAGLRGASLSYTNLRDAGLSGADLRGADLIGADLIGANLWSTIGNQNQIITIQTDVWQIVYTSDFMQIGCQRHSINDWLVFSDDHISKMDIKALEFWKKWKPILVLILERNK